MFHHRFSCSAGHDHEVDVNKGRASELVMAARDSRGARHLNRNLMA